METPPPRRLAVGLASGVAVVAGTFLVAGFSPEWVVVALAQTVLYLLPDALLAAGILTLGSAGQPLLLVGAGLLAVGLFGGLALAALGYGGTAARKRAETVFLVGLVQTAAAFALSVAPLAALVGGGLGAATVGLAGRAAAEGHDPARRGLLRSTGAAAAALAAAGAGPLWRALGSAGGEGSGMASGSGESGAVRAENPDPLTARLLAAADERSFALEGAEPLVSERFYQVDKNAADPRVDPEEWSLAVTGAVGEPLEVDLADLESREMQHRFLTLRCVGDPINGRKTDTALWTGVPVASLLEAAGVSDRACCVMLRAADGYYEEFPLEALRDGMLAVRMNGAPLPRGHGAPVRALVPGHWGEINVKWLTEIEVLTEEARGYWEKRGWHGTGPVSTVAKLHHVAVETSEAGGASTVTVGGHAYAGTRGVSAVEVSVDGGENWREAELTEPLPGRVAADADPDGEEAVSGAAADAWRGWRHTYEASESHEVVVRAVEADGTVQPAAERDPFPSGASGRVSRQVDP